MLPGGRFYLFRLLGFPVYADASWFIILVFLIWRLSQSAFPSMAPGYNEGAYFVMALLGALGLFGSILLHEVGHMLEARRRRIPTGDITLHLFGGLATMYGRPRTPGVEATVALAGPAVTLVIAAACYGLWRGIPATSSTVALLAVLQYLWFINTVLLVFNLMPAFPLDGGRVLHAALWAISGKPTWAMRAAATVGVVFACLLILDGALSLAGVPLILGGGLFSILIGLYLFAAANAARKGVPV